MFLAIITMLSALSISGIAAFYSIVGLMTIFAGAKLSIAIMGTAMEVGKIVAALWLHHNWNRKTSPFLKMYLVFAVVVLMLITSIGIFGMLSKGHIENTRGSVTNDSRIGFLSEQVERYEKEIETRYEVLGALDNAFNEYVERGYISKGLAKREEQEPERLKLDEEITKYREKLEIVNEEVFELESQNLDVELEVGPIKYVSKIVYGNDGKDSVENSVRILIIALIFVFDPLAILLLIASQVSFSSIKPKEEKKEIPVDVIESEELARKEDETEEQFLIRKKKTRMSSSTGVM